MCSVYALNLHLQLTAGLLLHKMLLQQKDSWSQKHNIYAIVHFFYYLHIIYISDPYPWCQAHFELCFRKFYHFQLSFSFCFRHLSIISPSFALATPSHLLHNTPPPTGV